MSNINDCTESEDNHQSNLNLKRTQALKIGGGHLENKMAGIKIFSSKVVPLTLK